MADILFEDAGLSSAEPSVAALKAHGASSNSATNLSDDLNALQ